jgi:hypothetical protein
MSKTPDNTPLHIRPPSDRGNLELGPLLEEPFTKVWDRPPAASVSTQIRGRLMRRLAASREAEAAMITRRRSRCPRTALAPGATAQTLYAASDSRPLRPGEPQQVRLLELAAGTTLAPEALGIDAAMPLHREILVVSGNIDLAGQLLSQRDYHALPCGTPMPALSSAGGAWLFLRESSLPAKVGDRAFTILDREAGWPDFAPGLQRRVLWQRDGQAALLYFAQAGAQVPRHTHGHDEECLMLQGELLLDDVMLQPGDYQLAPAGTGHHITETDTGVVIYAHGDLDLMFAG